VARHPASVASGEVLFCFGDLERVVCSSIGHRDRGFEGLKWLGSCLGGESGRQFDGCPGLWGKLKDGLKKFGQRPTAI